jgi:hypothetical protein
MNGFQICKDIVGLHENITTAEIAEKGSTIAIYTKERSNMPKLDRLLVQTELYFSILQAGQEQLGKPYYILVHNDSIDLLFFQIVVNGRKMILVVSIIVPYEHEQTINKIREYIGSIRLSRV